MRIGDRRFLCEIEPVNGQGAAEVSLQKMGDGRIQGRARTRRRGVKDGTLVFKLGRAGQNFGIREERFA